MGNNLLPIILYDLDGKPFKTHNITTNKPCIYFYSYQNFNIRIVNGIGTLYSVLQKTNDENQNYLEINDGQQFTGFVNFGYTLHIPENKSSIIVELSNKLGNSEFYKFTLELDNQITKYNEHYNDLIINNYLPTYEELEPALLPDTPKADLIKRMLLDFRDIMRVKGTKKSIEKFFYFIGFLKEQIQVIEEYKVFGKDKVTTKPNLKLDTKTGNYHVLYNNWNDGIDDSVQALNDKNMPYRPFDTEDFNSLYESLKYAIPLANKYFTLVEQEITFFGICFSSNIPIFPSITSLFNQIFYHDINGFRKYLHIDLFSKDLTQKEYELTNYLVKNCIQVFDTAYRTEVKYIWDTTQEWYNNELYFVVREIDDNEEYNEDLPQYRRAFGALLRLKIKSPKTYISINITNILNELSQLNYKKTWCEDELELHFITEKPDTYKITIEITDEFNNVERYFYTYMISDDISKIDFELFNSLLMIDKNFDENHIDLDVDSGTITTRPLSTSRNYILNEDSIPVSLDEYFIVYTGAGDLRWLTNASQDRENENNPQYIIPSINKNFKISELTDTIPIELTEQWLAIVGIPYNNETVKIKVFNVDTCEYELHTLTDGLTTHDVTFDRLFIRYMDIIDQETNVTQKYLFISPTETGIELNQKTFDIYLDDKSIYEDGILRKIPVNYDFPLFPTKEEEIVYLSENVYKREINGEEYPIVKSMFPRMVNINSEEFDEFDILKLGDVILARINQDYIVNEVNVVWNVFNAFTNQLMYSTTDYMLKYRIYDNIVYTIVCEFDINQNHHKITKTGIFSSFKQINYEF